MFKYWLVIKIDGLKKKKNLEKYFRDFKVLYVCLFYFFIYIGVLKNRMYLL